MANQPETSSFDAGVYQLETTDPVQGGIGGVSNDPLINLTNRTRWLYDRLAALDAGTFTPSWIAPKNSPALTGSPTCPTQPMGDSSTKLANTEFVRNTLALFLSKSVAGSGNLSLSATEAGTPILHLTGALTGDRTILFPTTAGRWVVRNATSGSFLLNLKTSTGATPIPVVQGRSLEVYGDGAELQILRTDFRDAGLTGTPTAPTAAAGTNTTQIASTAFVQQELANYQPFITGDVKFTLRTTAPTGWVMMNDGTIGSAASGATTRANADTEALYTLLWNGVSNTYAPVSGGRGASAAADFAANKPIRLPLALGRALAAAGSGAGLTARALGEALGAETHQLSEAQMPAHIHGASADAQGSHSHTGLTDPQGDHQHGLITEGMGVLAGYYYLGPNEGALHVGSSRVTNSTTVAGAHQHNVNTNAAGVHAHNITIGATGSSQAHPNMQPTIFLNVMVKL